MKAKKTIHVDEITAMANELLAYDSHNKEFRQGVSVLIEAILHRTNNYRGYRFLTQNETFTDVLPGTREFNKETGRFNFENTDNTRIKYS